MKNLPRNSFLAQMLIPGTVGLIVYSVLSDKLVYGIAGLGCLLVLLIIRIEQLVAEFCSTNSILWRILADDEEDDSISLWRIKHIKERLGFPYRQDVEDDQ